MKEKNKEIFYCKNHNRCWDMDQGTTRIEIFKKQILLEKNNIHNNYF